MPDVLQIIPGPTASHGLEDWIDRAVRGGRGPEEVAAGIAAVTRPGGTREYEESPELSGNENWLWPWNRAGFLYLERQAAADAATIFECAYLAALRFQNTWQYRIHKGMPLCNVAYARLTAGDPDRAGLPALLGMVEDAMTGGNPTETASFRNLLAAGFPDLPARSLADLFLFLTRRRGVAPLYPETVLDSAFRGNALPSRDWVDAMRGVAAAFTPETIPAARTELAGAWDLLRPTYRQYLRQRVTNYGEGRGVIPTNRPATADRGSTPARGHGSVPGDGSDPAHPVGSDTGTGHG